jgi:hypothetical protein
MNSGYGTSWKVPPENRDDPACRAAGRRMDFAQAVYDWTASRIDPLPQASAFPPCACPRCRKVP